MKVSIIIPTYNREEYLPTAIDSILNQTYNNYEIIVIDDGSTDSTKEIITDYCSKYPGKIISLFQQNSGPTIARNKGIKTATGHLIAFLDSDDLYEPTKLEDQVAIFKESPGLAFVYTGYNTIDANGSITRSIYPDPIFQGYIYKKLWLCSNEISGGTIMVSKTNLEKVGLFSEALQGAENLDLRLKLAKLGDVRYSDKLLYNYRRHESNLTSQTALMSENRLAVIQSHLGKHGKNNHKLWLKVMSGFYFDNSTILFGKGEFREARKLLTKAIKLHPLSAQTWVLYFRCFLGAKINHIITTGKKLLASTLKRN